MSNLLAFYQINLKGGGGGAFKVKHFHWLILANSLKTLLKALLLKKIRNKSIRKADQ